MENTTETKEIVGTIGYDPFVLRQFKPDFKGTNLSRIDQTKLLDLINVNYQKFLTTKEDAERYMSTYHTLYYWDWSQLFVPVGEAGWDPDQNF